MVVFYMRRSSAVLLACSFLSLWAQGVVLAQPPQEKVTQSRFFFGAPCSITAYGKVTRDDFSAVFQRLGELERLLSIFDEDSALSLLNRNAGIGPVAVPTELFEVVRHGIAYSHLSEGAFDISIGPLVTLWSVTGNDPHVPATAEVSDALALVDFRKVILLEPEHRILLEKEGMSIDLGGIAKGYAADVAAQMLEIRGISSALVNLGGNVATVGSRPDGSPWRVSIQHPEKRRGDAIGVLEVAGEAVVTSGKYERYFTHQGIRYHHIIDTQDGFPVENGIVSVTVVADSSIKADALSTAVFSLGTTGGLELVRSFDGVDAIIVTGGLDVYVTEGIADSFHLEDASYRVVR